MTVLRLLVVLTAGLVCGCNAFTPFSTAPASPAKGVTDTRQRVGICVNPLKASLQQVQQTAQAECIGKTVAERVTGDDYWLDVCPLAVPDRVTFACTPSK